MVAPVEQRSVAIERDFIARTEAVPTVEVRARVAGILEDVLFKEGMDVKKGQPLFIIQHDEYAAALESARASSPRPRPISRGPGTRRSSSG